VTNRRPKVKIRVQRGGALINNGSYGCIIGPNKPCKKLQAETMELDAYVSKLYYGQYAREDRDEEWEKLQEIARLDPNFEFTIEPVDSCDIPNTGGDVGECTNKASVQQIILRNGGPDLYGFESKKIPDPIGYADFLNAFHIVMKGFKKFEDADIVHRDIKPANMLYRGDTKRFYVVDFGLSSKRSEVYTPNALGILKHFYAFYPPEFRIMGFLYESASNYSGMVRILRNVLRDPKAFRSTQLGKESITNLLEYYKMATKRPITKAAMDEAFDTHENDIMDMLKEMLDKFESGKQEEVIKRMSEKVDVYSLGVTMMYLLHNQFIKVNNKAQHENLKYVFVLMTHPNVFKRSSIKDVVGQVAFLISHHKQSSR